MFFCAMTTFFSCNKKCEVSPLVESTFSYHFTMLNSHQKNKVLSSDFINSLSFLSEISKIDSKANFGDVSVYIRYKDYISDVKRYKNWYNENKCHLTREQIVSISQKSIHLFNGR